jgi:hypothetical protein
MYNPHMRWKGAAAAVFVVLAWAGVARAQSPWVYRSIVLDRGEFAVDMGLGLGHTPDPNGGSFTGLGVNLELAAGITHELELGVRTGLRFDDGGRATQADQYGRPFDTQTFGTNFDTVANPEVHFRWAVARGSAAELGLELRFYLPIESGSSFGMMFGLPITLHAASLRLDTGLYLPVIFTSPNTTTIVSVPFHLWIQASRTFFLGPLFDLRVFHPGDHDAFLLGFGLGTSLTRTADLRTWIVFPDLNQNEAARTFGAGVAFQLRFG